jgi:hypothetical protein
MKETENKIVNTCIMYVKCWRCLSLPLNKYRKSKVSGWLSTLPTVLTKIIYYFFSWFYSPVMDLRLLFSLFPNLFWHMVGLLGWVISLSQGLYLHRTPQHRTTRTNIHVLSGIRTCDPVYERLRPAPQTAWPLDWLKRNLQYHKNKTKGKVVAVLEHHNMKA